MAHTCDCAVITCIDFRFQEALYNYIHQTGCSSHDRISVAGAIKNLAVPENEAEKNYLLNQIDISVRLHQIKKIVLINHEDCGAYGGKAAFKSAEDEHNIHFEHMNKVRQLLNEKYPALEVRIVWARIDDEGVVTFEEESA